MAETKYGGTVMNVTK